MTEGKKEAGTKSYVLRSVLPAGLRSALVHSSAREVHVGFMMVVLALIIMNGDKMESGGAGAGAWAGWGAVPTGGGWAWDGMAWHGCWWCWRGIDGDASAAFFARCCLPLLHTPLPASRPQHDLTQKPAMLWKDQQSISYCPCYPLARRRHPFPRAADGQVLATALVRTHTS